MEKQKIVWVGTFICRCHDSKGPLQRGQTRRSPSWKQKQDNEPKVTEGCGVVCTLRDRHLVDERGRGLVRRWETHNVRRRGRQWTGEARTRGARGLVQRKLQRMARGRESAGWKENQAESRVTVFFRAKWCCCYPVCSEHTDESASLLFWTPSTGFYFILGVIRSSMQKCASSLTSEFFLLI